MFGMMKGDEIVPDCLQIVKFNRSAAIVCFVVVLLAANNCSEKGVDPIIGHLSRITETNAVGGIISNDPADWCFDEADSLCPPPDSADTSGTGTLIPLCYAFGPAFPNPTSSSVKIACLIPVATSIHIWVEAPPWVRQPNPKADFVSMVEAGAKTVVLDMRDWEPATYRVHIEGGGLHCTGDVRVVEPF